MEVVHSVYKCLIPIYLMPGKHTVQHYHLILHTQKTSSGDLIVHSIASHYTD